MRRCVSCWALKLPLEVLLANGEASIRAAMQLTKAVPVIFIGSGDPVEEGLVKAAAHGFAVTIDFAPARHRLPTILALRAVGADGGLTCPCNCRPGSR